MVRALALAALAAATLAACAGPTPYRPAVHGEGYTERRIEADRYRVEFAGNASTPRRTVEDYLVYRAAEITLGQGKDYFRIVERHTTADTTYVAYDDFPGYGFYDPWHPFGYRHRFLDPWPYRRPFMGGSGISVTYRPITRYHAHAEIALYAGPKPADNANAFDARDVLARLGPTIKRPERGPLP